MKPSQFIYNKPFSPAPAKFTQCNQALVGYITHKLYHAASLSQQSRRRRPSVREETRVQQTNTYSDEGRDVHKHIEEQW